MSNAQEPKPLGVLLSGLWEENPTLVTNLGLCPTLAVTNSVANGLTMGIATLFVLVCSSFLVSSVRRHVPNEVRIATFVLIIATFVTVADMALEALVPTITGSVRLKIPETTQAGQVFRLKGHGMPVVGKAGTRGDLYATVDVQLPRSLTQEQRQHYEALAKLDK